MNDFYDGPRLSSSIDRQSAPEAVAEPTEDAESALEPELPQLNEAPIEAPAEDATLARFKSCRWYETQSEGAPYCNNRDVLPFAGKNGFKPEAWCPDCSLFKVKRTARKRSPDTDYNL